MMIQVLKYNKETLLYLQIRHKQINKADGPMLKAIILEIYTLCFYFLFRQSAA